MRAVDVANSLCPSAHPSYRAALDAGDALLAGHGIDRRLRLAHFLAQVFHETGGLSVTVESGRYSAKTLGAMWDAGNWRRYFSSREACVAMAEQCRIDGGERLFSLVYGGRMGNGGPETRDGWTYRGRGLMQTTGKSAYSRYGKACGADFLADPERILDPRWALIPAVIEWNDGGCNRLADTDGCEAITRVINGGTVGLGSRRRWLQRIKTTLGIG